MKLRLKLSRTAVAKYRSKPANWTDEMAYHAEMTARAAGLVAFGGTGKAESFVDGRWQVVGRFEPMVGPQERHEYIRASALVLDAGCARCGEPLDAKADEGLCSPCYREVRAKERNARPAWVITDAEAQAMVQA